MVLVLHRFGLGLNIWGFNADHQPLGGIYDNCDERLVSGCLLASYITFDLSPELSITPIVADPVTWCDQHIPGDISVTVRNRLDQVGITVSAEETAQLMAAVWPAMCKMKTRDDKYAAARAVQFSTDTGRAYIRELSIDELPGLTTPNTIAIM